MTDRRTLPIQSIPSSLCSRLKILFSDIDDTITTEGLLTAAAFASLWQLHKQAIEVVMVTGRPAGWCDHIARMWPVAGVVGENGAFFFAYNRRSRRMERHYLISEPERTAGQKKLARIRERVLKEVPACRIAADQAYRITDLAIDISEDVGPLSQGEVDRICGIITDQGASYKISSIHINCWYGSFDKVRGVKEFVRINHGQELAQVQDQALFIGDSPNDEPMFKAMPNTIAVANIARYLPRLTHLPRYITERESAAGFCQSVETILSKRAAADVLS